MDCNQVFVSRVKRLIVGFTLFCAVFGLSNVAFANTNQDHEASHAIDSTATTEHGSATAAGHKKEEGGFDITSFIFHHISDSHYFTLWGHNEHGVTLHLPIILYTNGGLVTFSSSAFEYNDDGTKVVEKNGQRFVMAHNKIYYANATADEHGAYVTHKTVDGEEVITNVRPLDLSITKNVFSMLLSVFVLMLVFFSVAASYRKRQGKSPKGMQSFLEPIILFVRDDIARPNLGHKYAAFMPYLLSVFFFIWMNNMLGLVPFFPGGANVTGNIAMTAVLAVCTYLITTFKGNGHYWKHIFWMPGVPVPMKIFLAPLELIGTLTKPIALAIRLFANITAGHILVMSLLCLIFIFNSIWIAPASIFFAVFIGLIEFLVAFIQAFIFTTLSALFIGMAVEEHH